MAKHPIKGTGPSSRFRHETLVFRDADEFLATAMPFISGGLEAGEPVLVVVSDRNVGLLGQELGNDAAEVRFAAIEEVARNPARLIPFWRDFLEENAGDPVRGLEEPAWPGRRRAELEECDLHNSLLNVAFPADAALSLLCACDATVPSTEGGQDGSLTAPPDEARPFAFDRRGLSEVRRRVERAAAAAGLGRSRTGDLVVAASELAANSVAHGGGRGTLRTWHEDDRLMVQFEDGGRFEEPLAGRLRPAVTQEGGRGLWLANQLCDLVQIRSSPTGTTVRLQAALG